MALDLIAALIITSLPGPRRQAAVAGRALAGVRRLPGGAPALLDEREGHAVGRPARPHCRVRARQSARAAGYRLAAARPGRRAAHPVAPGVSGYRTKAAADAAGFRPWRSGPGPQLGCTAPAGADCPESARCPGGAGYADGARYPDDDAPPEVRLPAIPKARSSRTETGR